MPASYVYTAQKWNQSRCDFLVIFVGAVLQSVNIFGMLLIGYDI